MDENTLNTFLRDLKFVVLSNVKTGKAFEIFFDFNLPNMHEEIYAFAKEKYSKKNIHISIQGGGRITKKNEYIIFHGRSAKYGKYEDEKVLSLAPLHPFFESKKYIILSKSGDDDVEKIIKTNTKLSLSINRKSFT